MDKYHYTECGLENIYLINGYEINKTKNGDAEIFIHDIHGLHKQIGLSLVSKRGLLSGAEIKFIRTTLDLSQKTFAKLLGLNYQTILAWEKNKTSITKTADHLLRILFFAYLDTEKSRTIYDKVNEIADFDAKKVKVEKLEFEEVGNNWRIAA